jgi:peptide/nickel transport system substrate-binding protein
VKKKIIWILVSCLTVLSLVIASCGPKEEEKAKVTEEEEGVVITTEKGAEEKVVTEKTEAVSSNIPKYGGSLRLALNADSTSWDDVVTRGFVQPITFLLTNESMWRGDWTKGPAGGYGTNESDWLDAYDIFDQKAGFTAESWEWSLDSANNKGTLIWHLRDNVHYGLNPDSEASRLVGGREMTADDVVFSFTQVMTDSRAYMYKAYPTMRQSFQIEKTGPLEVTITVALPDLITAIAKFGNYVGVIPPEVVAKYGDMASWKNSVGTGPFMLTDVVPGSRMLLERNPNYWGTDPIGPGQGNQLPYIDSLQYLIIPDASTRLAALRTGKIDAMVNIGYEDAENLRATAKGIMEAPGAQGGTPWYIYMNSQREPFNNIKVRRAMLMGVDLELIKNTLNHGLGQILTYPIEYTPAYADCYLSLDDPDCPESVKELYVYNPDKAKTLLAEAGYPNGFKTTALISQSEVDYFSVIKDMWKKIGVDLELDVRESGAVTSVYRSGDYNITGTAGGRGPISVFYHMVTMVGEGAAGGNGAQIDDPVCDEASAKMQAVYLTDAKEAMRLFRELMKYFLDQAYVVTAPHYAQSNFYWPWLKNYSGEYMIGYYDQYYWAAYIWIDEALKESMGH